MAKKYCKVCGIYEAEDIPLTTEVVGKTVSKEKLEEKEIEVKRGDKILLCEDCLQDVGV